VVIHTYHGHVFTGYFNSFLSKCIVWFDRLLAKKTNYIVAISNLLKNELLYSYKIANQEKIMVLPLILNASSYHLNSAEKRRQFRQSFNLDNTDFVIGCIGRVVPIKNLQLICNAMSSLVAINPKIKLIIVGEGESKAALEQLVQVKNLMLNVVFTTWETDISKVLHSIDLLAITSINEGTPVVIYEAGFCSKPVVAAAVGSIPEMITHGVNGLLFNLNDEATLKQHILTLSANQQQSAQLGVNLCNSVASSTNANELLLTYKRFFE
jgi:glycosyltransferase involved in cell wall biosynthesis